MNKHTPRPWAVAVDGERIHVEWAGSNLKAAYICAIFGFGNADETQRNANAHLIAAAPDLLAALEHCENVMAEHSRNPGPDLNGYFKGAIESAGAAIAKATGNV